ncbi:Lar family restriction alleviation protein [Achromobacter aloeverae]|uniref:Lar family restriction alleviation protein n=1 Tax=Achromobacter aloeverae TaxID=1750518 RepID=UPI0013011339|nr:Lar family restriction alleviation protein [Achromobacter aloeverae]
MTTQSPKAALKPCPFCGGEPVIDACDRLIAIKCETCRYSRAFSGLLQTKESSVRISDQEFYHKDAHEQAIASWNTRAQPQQEGEPVLAAAMALLVAGGFVAQAKVDEAIQIALNTPGMAQQQDAKDAGWQSIASAPKDGSYLLLRGKGDHRIADGYWLQAAYNGVGAWVWPYVHSEPMMWMPIPAMSAAPSMNGGEGG